MNDSMRQRQAEASEGERPTLGATYAALRHPATYAPRANPGDPVVRRPRQGRHGPMPGPDDTSSPGRTAIVQGQVFLVAVIVLVQLWLVTTSLLELLSGHGADLDALTAVSGLGVLIALLVWQWPRRRVLNR
jgi:hypothetical protein